MSISVAPTRIRRAAPLTGLDEARDRRIRRRVGLAWGLLILNALTFYPRTWSGLPLVVPIPTTVGKLITQGSLPVALLIALSVNRRIAIRPNVYMCLVSLLAIEAVMTGMQDFHLGTQYRTFRLVGFVITLWLLTPWWGRRDLLLVRCHLIAAAVVLGSVVVGLAVAPSDALGEGRLAGALWPSPPTQVAEFAAVTAGLVIVAWLAGRLPGRLALWSVPVLAVMLVLTHTRTALIGLVAGVLVAGLSLFVARARVRRVFTVLAIVISVGAITVSSAVTNWLARGEGVKGLTTLTGRTSAWSAVVSLPRDMFQVLFGFGISNESVNGIPIDSSWLSAYYDLGLFAVVVGATMLVYLLVSAYFRPSGPQRALGLFLVTYCIISSFTETGLSGASITLLELTLGASLLVSTGTEAGPL
jgi:hypothetical protein